MKIIVILCALALGGCASIPAATGIALVGAGVAVGGLALDAYHNCRADGGCKAIPLPK